MNAARRQKQLKAEAEDLENARFIHKADIVIMTESTDDEPFWKAVFRYSLPEMKIKFIFHTITYSWENHYCWTPSLDDWYKGQQGVKSFSFENFLTGFSKLLHPYLIKLLSAKKLRIKDWTLDDMCQAILSIQPNKKEYQDCDGKTLISAISQNLKLWANSLTLPPEDTVQQVEKYVNSKGESYFNAYLYMQGHCIYDTVCRLGAALTGITASQFKDRVLKRNLAFGRYPEINILTADIRHQLKERS